MVSIVRLTWWIGVPLMRLSLIGATALTWRRYNMAPINIFGLVVAALVVGYLAFEENFETGQPRL